VQHRNRNVTIGLLPLSNPIPFRRREAGDVEGTLLLRGERHEKSDQKGRLSLPQQEESGEEVTTVSRVVAPYSVDDPTAPLLYLFAPSCSNSG
jgi:hypothetical protein